MIDYTREDFTQGAARYDLIFDIPGNHPFSASRRALAPEGIYVLIGHDNFGRGGRRFLGGVPRILGLTARSLFTRQLPKASFAMPSKQESMAELAELLESGKLAPVIDQTFSLAEAADAIDYLASGQARGRIVIEVADGDREQAETPDERPWSLSPARRTPTRVSAFETRRHRRYDTRNVGGESGCRLDIWRRGAGTGALDGDHEVGFGVLLADRQDRLALRRLVPRWPARRSGTRGRRCGMRATRLQGRPVAAADGEAAAVGSTVAGTSRE